MYGHSCAECFMQMVGHRMPTHPFFSIGEEGIELKLRFVVLYKYKWTSIVIRSMKAYKVNLNKEKHQMVI
ncbi:hypothetical protein Prudu_004703 [Prunus dulcis]|uniref:Uncharacterized protein n=1 Tax=Prunus dulcis TaxID=3755 RepID=A0A4Y1QVY9_PRUDU|nr:hypothetical protein Prudu_004703 [Prunus dulcis]